MKLPEIGTMVYWYPEGDRNAPPFPAFVVRHGMELVDLHIMSPELRTFLVRSGVPHVAMAGRKMEDLRECGVWDYPQQKPTEKGKASG